MNRQEFINLSGGVFSNDHFYSQWSGAKKAEYFWDFFDDTTDDYMGLSHLLHKTKFNVI